MNEQKKEENAKRAKDALNHRDFKVSFEKLVEKLVKEHKLKPINFRVLWVLSERLRGPFKCNGSEYEIYPAVAFVGRISK